MAVDLKKVPSTPGVYKFFSKNEIIYIGKAFKQRVSVILETRIKIEKLQIKFLTDKLKPCKSEVKALL